MFSAIRNTALAAAALGVLASGTAARANIISDFSGVCTDFCDGTATAVLTLTNAYVPGTDITTADFVSLAYASDTIMFTIAPGVGSGVGSVGGGLNADGSISFTSDNKGDIGFQAGGGTPILSIVTEKDGFAQFFADGPGPSGEGNTDGGSSFTFSPLRSSVGGEVPEPASLSVLALGLAGLGVVLRTRRI